MFSAGNYLRYKYLDTYKRYFMSILYLVYTVRYKKLHPSYWYNNFAKLCHTVMIFVI